MSCETPKEEQAINFNYPFYQRLISVLAAVSFSASIVNMLQWRRILVAIVSLAGYCVFGVILSLFSSDFGHWTGRLKRRGYQFLAASWALAMAVILYFQLGRPGSWISWQIFCLNCGLTMLTALATGMV